jgi:hypothetical protein
LTDSNDSITDAPAPADDQITDAPAASDDARIPLSRFQKVTDENRTLREQIEQLNTWKQEQEQAAMSELDRERIARETAEQQLTAAQMMVQQMERSQLVRTAASAAGLADPDDAVALCDLNAVTTADEALAAVTALVERKPHLVRSGEAGPRQMGTPLAQAGTQPLPTGPDGQTDERAAVGADLLRMIQRGR